MGARYVQGIGVMRKGLPVATAQYVEQWDMVAFQTDTIVRAQDITWATAIATPTAPTVANGAAAGTALTNALTAVKISYQFPFGEGPLSAAGSATPTANFTLKVSGAPLVPPAPAMWTNIYVETAAGSGVFKLWGRNFDGTDTYVSGYGTGAVPTAAPVTASAQVITQYNFALLFAGVSTQRKCSASGPNQALFGQNQRVYGNSADNIIMVARGGIWEFDCTSASFQSGQYVGPDKDTGNNLLNQQVALVVHPALSIGRVAEDTVTSAKVQVEIYSSLLPIPAEIYSGLRTIPGVLPN